MQGEATGDNGRKMLEPGEMFGDYTVEKLLGEGGMGAVYLVRAPEGERYAVKVMFPEMVKKGSDYRKRFAREAEFAMKIRHKNLISVYDVGEDPETGLCYIIMDYVPGGSVADRLEKNGPLPMAEAVSIAAQVALALEVAHRHGVIHRDIKPDNIMFDADGTPKLADLGVAKFTDEAHKTTVTTTGMIIGTPAYMAPEQMMDSHHIDARADIYALGVVLYEMLTGKRPNEGSTAVELLAKALKGEPLPDVRTMRPEVSAAIAHVLSLMCAPKPENRPSTALAAAELLQKAAAGRLVLPKKRPRAADAAARKKKRGFPIMGIAAVAVVAVLCSVVGIANLLNKSSQPTSFADVPVLTTTNIIERTVVVTNLVEREIARTSLVTRVIDTSAAAVQLPPASQSSDAQKVVDQVYSQDDDNVSKEADSTPDSFTLKPPLPKVFMLVHEEALNWFGLNEDLPQGTAIRVCHDLSHGGFPGTNQVFYSKFLAGRSGFAFKPCWHDLTSENLDSVNVLVLPSSPAQILYDDSEHAVIKDFLSRGGTVIAFVDSNENNVWAMNKFFSEYGLEVFIMDEYASMRKEERGISRPAIPVCAAAKGLSPELKLHTFAAPVDEISAKAWSSMMTAGQKRRTILASRRVGKGNLVFASTGWYWHGSQDRFLPITSKDNERFWTGVFLSAARNLPIRDSTAIGERAVTDAPIMLSAGPIVIYSAVRWRDSAYKLRDIVRQALPHIERYCGKALDPAEMEFTKFVMTGTSIWGYVPMGPKTLVTSATFRGFPDKITYFSEFVFKQMVSGATGGNSISLSGYIANLVLGDIGFPGELAARIREGRKRDPDFTKFRLTDRMTIRDRDGKEVVDDSFAILYAKNYSALEDIRSRHPDVISAYLSRRKQIVGHLSRSQSVGILTAVTGEDCFKIYEKYGIECSRGQAAINPASAKEKNERDSIKVVASNAVKSHVIFPCADPKDTKWKSRTPWRYVMRPPAAVGLKWTEPNFRDSSWKRTNKPLGVGKSKELMRIADRWSTSRLYLRRRFGWKGGKVVNVVLTVYHACNVRVYLNGELVLEKVDRNDWWEEIAVPVNTFAESLRIGDNVLAIEAQDNLGVRFFDCGLKMETEEAK